jgi:rfaE bifunctional protein kinase chain/domain
VDTEPGRERIVKTTRKRLLDIVSAFQGKSIAVIGDMVADEFIYATSSRVSREAPVLIFKYDSRELVLGGAANAVNNVSSLGGRPLPVGVIGDDQIGKELVGVMKSNGIVTVGLVVEKGRCTVTKTRVLAGVKHTTKQQVMRIDKEDGNGIGKATEQRVVKTLNSVLQNADAVIVSDYGYGLFTPEVRTCISRKAGKKEVVTVDSRYGMLGFKGITAVTPNESEVEEALHIKLNDGNDLIKAGGELIKKLNSKGMLITRGKDGMAVFEKGKKPVFIPVFGSDEAVDVTGAGDTVISAFTLALSAGAGFYEAARIANYAGGIVVMKSGTATVSKEELVSAIESDFE